MNLSFPTSLKQVFKAPKIDYDGNILHDDWSVSVKPYSFAMPPQAGAMRFSGYEPIAAWPKLYDFLGKIYEATEPSNAPGAMIRQLAIDIAQGGDANVISTNIANGILQCKGLMAVAIVGLAMTFIVVPIFAGLAFFFGKLRYRNDFRYDPYTSDSIATAVVAQNNIGKKRFKTRSHFNAAPKGRRKSAQDAVPTHSSGMIALAAIAIFTSFCAAFGVGGSFYFNDSFSFSLNRTTTYTLDAMDDVTQIINEFTTEITDVSNVIQTDIDGKIQFGTKAIEAFGSIFQDAGTILDLAQKSMALGVFLIAMTWENSAIKPLESSVEDAQAAIALFGDSDVKLVATSKDGRLEMSKSLLCNNAGSAVRGLTLPATCKNVTGLLGLGNNTLSLPASALTTICQKCLVPDFPDTINPFSQPQNNIGRAKRVLSTISDDLQTLQQVKLGEITISQQALMGQLNGLQGSFKDDFSTMIDYYMDWYDWRLKPIIEGGSCDDTSTTRTSSTTTPKPVTTARGPTNATVRVTVTTTPEPETTTEPELTGEVPLTQLDIIVMQIQEAFNDRHYVTLMLLCVATVQLFAMIVGCVCLLVVFCQTGRHQDRSMRARGPSTLEKVGRGFIIGYYDPPMERCHDASF